jgi:hypothetical protein
VLGRGEEREEKEGVGKEEKGKKQGVRVRNGGGQKYEKENVGGRENKNKTAVKIVL